MTFKMRAVDSHEFMLRSAVADLHMAETPGACLSVLRYICSIAGPGLYFVRSENLASSHVPRADP